MTKRLSFFLCLTLAPLLALGESGFGTGEGVAGEVLAIAVQKDGKVVIGGAFSSVNGVPRQNLARLNPDGSVDPGFISEAVLGPNGPVAALLLLPDGGIVAGGNFSSAGNLVRTDLVKFLPDGTADPKFADQEGGVGTNGSVAALALQPDGSIIVGGRFTSFFGQVRRGIARLNPDGTLAAGPRQSSTLNGAVAALGIFPDGTAMAGGRFSDSAQSARGILKAAR
jgi:uncharacterized delta-60 repeat protein